MLWNARSSGKKTTNKKKPPDTRGFPTMGNPLFIFLQAVLAEADKELEYVRPCRLNVYKKKDDKA